MASQLRQLDYQVTNVAPAVPAGTPANGAVSTPVPLGGDRVLVVVELYVPPGSAGQVGAQLQLSGSVILPFAATPGGGASYVFNAGDWLIIDGDRLEYDIGMEVDSGLKIVTYNTGTFTHTWQWRFKTADVPAAQTASATAVIVPIVQAPVAAAS
jgi:hypothetical protein